MQTVLRKNIMTIKNNYVTNFHYSKHKARNTQNILKFVLKMIIFIFAKGVLK